MSEESKSLDILGIKPYGEAADKLVHGALSFLSRICSPAADEFGLFLQDHVREWRLAHLIRITKKAEERLQEIHAPNNVQAHPRIVSKIIEEGSWNDDAVVQDMWGGLLSASCTETGDDDSNLVFINLLSDMSSVSARVLNFVCENCVKRKSAGGLIVPGDELSVTYGELCEITGLSDADRLDYELDHMRNLGLLQPLHTGFESYDPSLTSNLTPSSVGMRLYVRCQGTRKSPVEYFNLDTETDEAK